MRRLSFLLFSSLVLLTGCHLFDKKQDAKPPINTSALKETSKTRPFTKDTLFTLLTAEFAERRGEFDLALNNYIIQAQETKDPKVAARAYQIASYMDDNKTELDMALLWISLEPESLQANRAIALELTKNKQNTKALPYIEKVLSQTDQLDFLSLADSNLSHKTQQEFTPNITLLLTKHPSNASLLYTKAILLADNNEPDAALATLEKLPVKTQRLDNIIILKAYLLQNTGKSDQAINLLNKETKNLPENKRLRLTFIHRLISQNKLTEAKQQLLKLSQDYPDDEEVRFVLVLISIENKEWDEAIKYLKTMQEHGLESDSIYFYLATAYNEKGDKQQALNYYEQVKGGENHSMAVIGATKILFEQHKIAQAQQLLSNNRQTNPHLSIPLYLFEVDELQKQNKQTEAWQVINQAIKTNPNNTSLLYSRALLAEQRNNISQAEKDLQHIIKLEPNNDSAINALGYILTNHTTRYQEALQFIQKALKLNPSNPATLDSMGWVKYKLGDLNTAQTYLQQAYENYPDPEVAAHLGEVYWQKGNLQEAKAIWSKALKDSPTNTYLKQTIKRFVNIEEL